MQTNTSRPSGAPGTPAAWLIWVQAARRVDGRTWLAMACIIAGWFFLDTLSVTAGPIRQSVRFYDLAALISNPLQLFSGIDAAHRWQVIGFALLCILVLLAPLVPQAMSRREAWLANLAPLAFMVACGTFLYIQTSGDFITQPADDSGVASDVVRFANKVLRRGSEPIARHVAVGAGIYVALAGSVFLAWRGISRFRGQPARPGSAS